MRTMTEKVGEEAYFPLAVNSAKKNREGGKEEAFAESFRKLAYLIRERASLKPELESQIEATFHYRH